jgi:hypothetical protein
VKRVAISQHGTSVLFTSHPVLKGPKQDNQTNSNHSIRLYFLIINLHSNVRVWAWGLYFTIHTLRSMLQFILKHFTASHRCSFVVWNKNINIKISAHETLLTFIRYAQSEKNSKSNNPKVFWRQKANGPKHNSQNYI